MSNLDHRVGVNEANLVVRTLKLTAVDEINKEQILTEIDQTFGIDAVSYDQNKQLLRLAYDATNISLHCIEDIIRKHHANIADSWWNHIKENYYKFVDQNLKDNASHQPWSCHQSPPGANKK